MIESTDGQNLEEAEQQYLRKAMRSGADSALVDDCNLHVNHGLARLTGHKREYDDRFVRMLLFTRALNSLFWARKSLWTGYMVQALLLTRSAMEDWGSAVYVQRHPEKAPLWLE